LNVEAGLSLKRGGSLMKNEKWREETGLRAVEKARIAV